MMHGPLRPIAFLVVRFTCFIGRMIGLLCAPVKPFQKIMDRPMMGLVMDSGDDKDKPREVKVYFRPSELEQIDEFREEWTRIKSRNDLFHVAIAYYMDKVRQSKDVTDLQRFPIDVAAEEHGTYTRGPTTQKKKGHGGS